MDIDLYKNEEPVFNENDSLGNIKLLYNEGIYRDYPENFTENEKYILERMRTYNEYKLQELISYLEYHKNKFNHDQLGILDHVIEIFSDGGKLWNTIQLKILKGYEINKE